MAENQASPLIASADLAEKVYLDSKNFGHNVYLCHHKTHGQVLMKTIFTGHQHCQKQRRSLLKEVEPLLKLNHTRIVRVLGVVLEDGPSYLVIQFFPKGNLLAVLDEVTIPISIKGRIILDILEGMEYLSNCGIIHKDLKPQNILVGEDFHIKIADLRLASCRAWSKLTMEESRRRSRNGLSTSPGTLFYMAPEHLLNINTPFTEKSDVFSFAVIVWVILTDREPYNQNPDDLVASAVCKGSRPDEKLIPCSTPVEMVALMKKCWCQDPANRPTFAESYRGFRYFYRGELEKNSEKDLLSLTGQNVRPDLVKKISSLALSEPPWQTDARSGSAGVAVETSGTRSQEGLWSRSLQTDAVPDACRTKEDPPPSNVNVTMRERKSEGVRMVETSEHCGQQYPGHRTRSWPVFPQEEPQRHLTGFNSAGLLLRQHSATVIIQNATGVQVGDSNRLTMGIDHLDGFDQVDSFRPSSSDFSQYAELLQKYEDHKVRKEQLDLLSKNIGQNWRQCARCLGLTNTEAEVINYDFGREGLYEVVHQILEKWQMKTGIVRCTMGGLCRALRDNVSLDLLCQLLLMCQGEAAP